MHLEGIAVAAEKSCRVDDAGEKAEWEEGWDKRAADVEGEQGIKTGKCGRCSFSHFSQAGARQADPDEEDDDDDKKVASTQNSDDRRSKQPLWERRAKERIRRVGVVE